MDPRKIDLNLLVLFEAVYSTRNVGKAAARLGITQPAVSNGLKRLRKQLGDPLFLRGGGGVVPSAGAHALIQRVREALGLLYASLDGDRIDLATYRRQFRLVMADPLEPVIMPPVLQLIIERAPGISIELVASPLGDFVDSMRAGTIDLALFTFPHDAPDIVTVAMGPVDMVVISRRGHPLIDGHLDIDKLQAARHLALMRPLRAQTHVPRDMAAHGLDRHVVCGVGKVWSFPWMVENTDLVAFAPRRFAETVARNHAIDIHESPVPIAEQYLHLMWHERSEDDSGHRWLREALIEASANWRARPGRADGVETAPAAKPRRIRDGKH